MRFSRTAIPGVRVVDPDPIRDARGEFYEALRVEALESACGSPFRPEQINFSTSRRNTLRGIHGVSIPPGQAKYVMCVRGAVRDIVVDLRMGSPTFAAHHVTRLDAGTGRAVYVPEGVGHGFLTLTDDACVCYVLSRAHVPGTQLDLDPLDPRLALPWGFTEAPLMSDKDAGAPTLDQALAGDLLPRWADAG